MVGWCLTGIVMMYVRYPQLSQADRLQHLQPVDWRGCCAASASSLADGASVAAFQVESLAGRPELRVQFANGSRQLIDLINGRTLSAVSPQDAARVASGYGADARRPARLLGLTSYDQWTVSGEFNRARPLYLYALDDPAGTQVYVSARTGQVIQVTTRLQRLWNWVGAVPHWLYFAQLRRDPALWSRVVIWTSVAGCFLAGFGIYIGLRQFLRRPAGRWSAYRGVLYWHHVPGLIFGLFALTWVASGLISMNPWGFLDSTSALPALDALTGPPLSGTQVKQALRFLGAASLPQVVAVESTALWGQPFLTATRTDGTRSRINPDGVSMPLTAAEWTRIALTLGGKGAASPQLLTAGDAYYYSRPGVAAQFPVYRLILNDAQTTRLYVDPVSGTVVNRIDRDSRWYRWLHLGLHTLDFSAATRARPVWDILMLLLLAGVTLICGTGTWMGWRRYMRIRPRR